MPKLASVVGEAINFKSFGIRLSTDVRAEVDHGSKLEQLASDEVANRLPTKSPTQFRGSGLKGSVESPG